MLRVRMTAPRMRRVALIYDATRAYDLKVMAGVAAYLRERVGWSVYIEETALKDQRLPVLASWHGDGIVANFDNPRVVRAVVRSRLPAVAFGSGYGWYDPKFLIPYLFTNNAAIARMAADHLLERGFRNFAYYGGVRTRINGWSVDRERAFSEHVRETASLPGLPRPAPAGTELGASATCPCPVARCAAQTCWLDGRQRSACAARAGSVPRGWFAGAGTSVRYRR